MKRSKRRRLAWLIFVYFGLALVAYVVWKAREIGPAWVTLMAVGLVLGAVSEWRFYRGED